MDKGSVAGEISRHRDRPHPRAAVAVPLAAEATTLAVAKAGRRPAPLCGASSQLIWTPLHLSPLSPSSSQAESEQRGEMPRAIKPMAGTAAEAFKWPRKQISPGMNKMSLSAKIVPKDTDRVIF